MAVRTLTSDVGHCSTYRSLPPDHSNSTRPRSDTPVSHASVEEVDYIPFGGSAAAPPQPSPPPAAGSPGRSSLRAGSRTAPASTAAGSADQSCRGRCAAWCTQSTLSNILTMVVLAAGLLMVLLGTPAGEYVFCFGVFGFLGGITNWLAVKMLFDRVPCLYGSGVIPKKHREIRRSIKRAIMATLFDRDFLEVYLLEKTRVYMSNLALESRIQEALESEEMEQLIDEKLYALSRSPEGLFLSLLSVEPATLREAVRPLIVSFSSDLAPLLEQLLEPGRFVSVDRIRYEVDSLLSSKLAELTPEMVTNLLEGVIREHLGWLVVWGNIFGGVIGVVAQAAGFSHFVSNPGHIV